MLADNSRPFRSTLSMLLTTRSSPNWPTRNSKNCMLSTVVENSDASSDSLRSSRLDLKPTSAALDFSLSNWSRCTTVRWVAPVTRPPGQFTALFAAPRPVKQLMNRSTVAAEPVLLKPPLLKPTPQFAYQVHSAEGCQVRLTFGCSWVKVNARSGIVPSAFNSGFSERTSAGLSGELPTNALSKGL